MLEMVQIIVVIFIDNDSNMICVEKEDGSLVGKPGEDIWELKKCQTQNMSLTEDLGSVNFLFCDKTGTLTKNELSFQKWACRGVLNNFTLKKSEDVTNFLRCITLCHDVLLITLSDAKGNPIE